jgi:hypothetical protein
MSYSVLNDLAEAMKALDGKKELKLKFMEHVHGELSPFVLITWQWHC